jgi:hypothetical protein
LKRERSVKQMIQTTTDNIIDTCGGNCRCVGLAGSTAHERVVVLAAIAAIG